MIFAISVIHSHTNMLNDKLILCMVLCHNWSLSTDNSFIAPFISNYASYFRTTL